jgi:hypothetical protein
MRKIGASSQSAAGSVDSLRNVWFGTVRDQML